MSTFSDRIKVTIDVLNDGANKGLKSFRTQLNETSGAAGKFKVATAGAMDFVKKHAAGFALAGGAALATFAVKAVDSFTDSAIAAGQFADATGLSVEQASQWNSVADDLGLNADTLQKAFLRLNKELGEGSEVAEKYGVQIQHTADGQVDMNATMLTAIDRIGGIKDPTERAAAAQEMFGRSYAEIAEIVLGNAADIQTALEGTSDAQVIDEDELRKAREYRESMDLLADVLTDITMTVGEELTPVLADLADSLRVAKEVADVVPDKDDGFLGTVIDSAKRAIDPVHAATSTIEDLRGAFDDTSETSGVLGDSITDLSEDTEDSADAQADAEAAAAEHTAALKAQAEQLKENVAALEEQIDAQLSAADANYALTEAGWDLTDQVEEANKVFEQTEEGSREWEEAQIDVAKASQKVADAVLRQAEVTAAANGKTLTATQRTDILNSSILAQAMMLNGPARAALIAHLAQINNLPTDVITKIEAAINAGDLATAETLLNNASRTRTASVRADNDDAAYWRAEDELNQLTRSRYVPIKPVVGNGGNAYYASGTPYAPGGSAIVGEEGPELVNLPQGASVTRAGKTAGLRGGGSGSNVTNYITQNFPAGARPQDVTTAQRKYTRTQGPL